MKKCLIAALILLVFACAKKNEENFQGHGWNPEGPAGTETSDRSPEPQPAAPAAEKMLEMDESAVSGQADKKSVASNADGVSMQEWFAAKGDIEAERLLEYSIELSFKTKDFDRSRNLLLATIKKYGFIRDSQVNTADERYLQTNFSIKTDSLYTVIDELNRLGTLESENISTVDHTLENVFNLIQKRREELRIERRLHALTDSYTTKQNYELREQYLAQSEDVLDQNEYQMRQVDDAIKWVKFSVNVTQKSESLFNIPDFTDAFVTMVNLFLRAVYMLIILIPYILIIIALILLRKPIARIIKLLPGRKKQ